MKIVRAKSAHAVALWDGRVAAPGDALEVSPGQAADLIARDPSEWVIPDKKDSAVVLAEIESRTAVDPPKNETKTAAVAVEED